ncbi:homoserine kinase [Mycetocola sp. BIGb0189]|uniref:homoserine kinase n=1 Tax=Mycetocola sp. BIGb0189 TaxID=2940604 RepID=UPI0021699B5C|nr:homoserine kinase [Mycetocola sp. BIGb0189]
MSPSDMPENVATLLGRGVRVRVPATSANLGPGFDTLGLALSVYDEIEVSVREEPGAFVDIHGVGEGTVPTDDTNLVVTSMAYAFTAVGQPVPGVNIVAHNTIPHGRGMGSSGAAVVAGIMAAKGLLAGIFEFSDEDLLRIATEIEGHPDNVAPALFGGLTIAWETPAGPKHKKLAVHRGVSPLVLVPEHTLSTKVARGLQPAQVPHEDAVFNVSRSALLIAALTQSPDLLWDATEDRLHQNYRASAMPATHELVTALREQGFPAVVSGAGPSILVLADGTGARTAAAAFVSEQASVPWQIHSLAVDVQGASVAPLSAA